MTPTSLVTSRTPTSIRCGGNQCHGAKLLHLETRTHPDGRTIQELYCPTCQPRGAKT